MRSRIGKVIGVLLVLVLIEVGTRGCVDWGVSRSIETNVDQVGDVTVASGDVPAAFHFWIMGGLQNGSVTFHRIMASPVNIASLSVSSHDLEFSRTELITGKAKLEGKAPYHVQVYLSPKNLGDYLNTTVHFQGPYLSGVIDTHPMDVKPELEGRNIVLTDGTYRYEVPLPGRAYLPCDPTGIGIGNGIAVSCDSRVPPRILADAAK